MSVFYVNDNSDLYVSAKRKINEKIISNSNISNYYIVIK